MSQAKDIMFISHGGGPLPLLGDPGHAEMVEQLQTLAREFPRPSAVLIISAHWEAPQATVTTAAAPDLIYDYSGFPPESYQIQYPAPGEPALAAQVIEVINEAGISARGAPDRGLDHGVFVPLKIMYPEADIPCVQLSLIQGLDAGQHLALGAALQQLNYPGLLVIGSGFSFHNMRAFFAPDSKDTDALNLAFERWLEDTLTTPQLSDEERHTRLLNWAQAPGARFCHPREEHLLPLHVCYGLAAGPANHQLHGRILGRASGMYGWQASARVAGLRYTDA